MSTKKNGGSRRRRAARKNKQSGEIPVEAIKYNGPIVTYSDKEALDTQTMTLVETAFISSNGAGVINTVFAGDPSTCGDWGFASNLYKEVRTLGFRVEYFPNNRYSKTTTVTRPLVTVKDRGSSTALGSYLLAMAYSSNEKRSLEDPWSEEMKMDGLDEGVFYPVTGLGVYSWIKLYADGLSLSTEYGMYVKYVRVQFRNRA